MPSANHSQMARDLEQLGLGDVRRVDELVAALLVALARVVLHHPPDGGTLRMEDGQPRADLGGEREEIELGPEAAVVPALGLLSRCRWSASAFSDSQAVP